MNHHVIQISSGTGPEETRRFVFMLARRLERLCGEHGLVVRDVAFHGDEHAPRSVALRAWGEMHPSIVYEQGSHVLIHRSRERGRAARKRWFAAVTILEATEETPDGPRIDRDHLVITACRAGGPGGQHVNKVSTAVRVEHVPSGIGVRVASERSQKANIEHAISRLSALLRAKTSLLRAAEAETRRLLHYNVVRGNVVRAYALTPRGGLVEARP